MYDICKSFLYMLYPLPLSIWMMSAGIILILVGKKGKKGVLLIILGFGILLVFSNRSVSYGLIGMLEDRHSPILLNHESVSRYNDVKFVVVLGGLLNYRKNLPITSRLNQPMLIRLIEAIRLYNTIPGMRFIVSSGGKFDVKEADMMAEMAIQLKVKEEDIIIERESDNTYQQAEKLKNIITNQTFFLVTSARHMPRSYLLFKNRGMNPIPAPTNHLIRDDYEYPLDLIIPSAKYLEYSSEFVYEIVGLLKEKLSGRI